MHYPGKIYLFVLKLFELNIFIVLNFRDGKLLVVGTRQNYLHVFSIESKELIRTIHLTDPQATIKDCHIIPGFCYENKLLLVLSQEGKLDLYNIETGQFMCNLNSNSIIHNQSQLLNEQKLTQLHLALSSTRYMCTTSHDGCIQVYDIDCSPIKTMKVSLLLSFYF